MASNPLPVSRADLQDEAKKLGIEKAPGAWRKEKDPHAVQSWGGLVGAVSIVKERKRKKIEKEAAAKHRTRNRPGRNADGTSDGTLGLSDIAGRLSGYNYGVPPGDTDVLKLMMKCPTNGCGRVHEDDWELVLTLWMTRNEGQRSVNVYLEPGRSVATAVDEIDIGLAGLSPGEGHQQQHSLVSKQTDPHKTQGIGQPGCGCCIS